MRTLVVVSFAALVLSGLVAPVALADDPPPITVPTPTVPVPQPDPGPVAKPRPKPQPQPRPATHRPAATPSRPVTRTYTPAPATVAPHPRAVRHPQKKRAAVKPHKPKPSAKKPSTKKQGVKGAAKTSNVTAPESATTSASTKWLRTALLLAVASILGVIAILFVSAPSPRTATSSARRTRLAAAGVRRRKPRPREVSVEVIHPKALRAPIPLPPVLSPELSPPDEATPAVPEELAADQLLADIAPPVAGPPASAPADTEVTLRPEPVRARPPFHEPALGRPTARQEQLVEAETPSFEETALQSPVTDADDVSVAPMEEVCAIGVWRGYVKSRFYAGLIGREEQGIEFALAESQPVRIRGNGTPERTGAAAEAHEALVNYLIESGWEVEPPANGESWYALRLRRAAAPAESNSA